MLDDFDDTSSFLDDLEAEDSGFSFDEDEELSTSSSSGRRSRGFKGLLGMTPVQTFILSMMLFFEVCFIGYFFMLVANKMAFP